MLADVERAAAVLRWEVDALDLGHGVDTHVPARVRRQFELELDDALAEQRGTRGVLDAKAHAARDLGHPLLPW